MKKIIICTIVLALLGTLGFLSFRLIRKTHAPEPTATATSTTANTTTAAATTRKKMSELGRQTLNEYKEYVIHGVVTGMPMEDVFFVLGPLEGKLDNSHDMVYHYKNIEMRVYSLNDAFVNPRIDSLTVNKGAYLGLTIGKNTKADADKMFGFGDQPYDEFVELSDGHSYSNYSNRHYLTVNVDYRDSVITAISVHTGV